MKTPKLCFIPKRMCVHEGFPSYVFVIRTWELRTVNFIWSCTTFIFLESACEMDSGTPRSAINRVCLGCLPQKRDSLFHDTSKGIGTAALTLLRLPQRFWMPQMILFSMTKKNNLALWEGLIFCEEKCSETTTHTVPVMSLIVFPDAMPVLPHAAYHWLTDRQYLTVWLHFTVC